MLLCLVGVLLVSCGSGDILRVRQFHLRETEAADGHLFIRAEMNKRLYGAVDDEERKARRGQYYDVRWRGLGGGEVKLVFEYRQRVSGAKVRRKVMVREGGKRGELSFAVNGEEYRRRGRVTSWRLRLYEGGELRDEKQSYLWE